MHWVIATVPGGEKVPVNLAQVVSARRHDFGNGLVTQLFYGGVGISVQGTHTYANVQVLETFEELLAMTPLRVGPVAPEETSAQLAATLRRKKSRA